MSRAMLRLAQGAGGGEEGKKSKIYKRKREKGHAQTRGDDSSRENRAQRWCNGSTTRSRCFRVSVSGNVLHTHKTMKNTVSYIELLFVLVVGGGW
jgi:hypothetical protein